MTDQVTSAVGAPRRFRHLKRGSTYSVVSIEFVEIWSAESDGGDRGTAWCSAIGERAKVQGQIASRSRAVFYRADGDGALWARSYDDFFDGRFEELRSETELSIDQIITLLTDGEGDTVTFCAPNADFNGLPNECITVNAFWTDWQDRDFRADTRAACLRMAVDAVKAIALTRKNGGNGA